jgi:alpha-mannosidase
MEASRPLIAVLADPSRPVPGSLLGLNSADVLVETLKVSEDGRAIVLRLFGVSGREVKARLAWKGAQPTAVYRTDLTEKPLARLTGKIEVPAYGVTMVRAEF